jgi:alcohol dehydrogenase (NADP+)
LYLFMFFGTRAAQAQLNQLSIQRRSPRPVAAFSLIPYRRNFAGSTIGGIEETQEMLDFCSKHNITADIELININQINGAYERLLKSDVRYRFVIDMATLKGS